MAGNNSSGGGATITTTPLLPSRLIDGDREKNVVRRSERPKEPWKGEFVKSIVYAGLDAIITSFSLISSISAGRLSSGMFFRGISWILRKMELSMVQTKKNHRVVRDRHVKVMLAVPYGSFVGVSS